MVFNIADQTSMLRSSEIMSCRLGFVVADQSPFIIILVSLTKRINYFPQTQKLSIFFYCKKLSKNGGRETKPYRLNEEDDTMLLVLCECISLLTGLSIGPIDLTH
ncbi:hypothetical protein AtEden1_Chr3g0179621 [Arabidopsis thaliana]